MIVDLKAAQRYANALYRIARDKNLLDPIAGEIEVLADLSKANKNFRQVFLTSSLSKQVKEEIIGRVFPNVETVTRDFLKVLVRKNRFNLLVAIAAEYKRLYDSDEGIEAVHLVTTFKLEQEQLNRFKDCIEQILGRKVRIKSEIKPALISGAIIYTRSLVIDGSLRYQLKALKQNLISRSDQYAKA